MLSAQVLALVAAPDQAQRPPVACPPACPAATLAAWLAGSPPCVAALSTTLCVCRARQYGGEHGGGEAGMWLRRTAEAAALDLAHAALASAASGASGEQSLLEVLQGLVACKGGHSGPATWAAGPKRKFGALQSGAAVLLW